MRVISCCGKEKYAILIKKGPMLCRRLNKCAKKYEKKIVSPFSPH
jgi:hypothetical protein